MNKPGAEQPETVDATPTSEWADDSVEWVTVEYGGPALEVGMYYQWSATSVKKDVPITTTEDLRGLFYLAE